MSIPFLNEIVLATQNRDKMREIKDILGDLKIEILTPYDFRDVPQVVEDGKTLEENAFKKARVVADFTGKYALADDSGLEVDALDGAPGVYSSRFAGEGCTYRDNNIKLLKLLENVNERGARFRCVVVLVNPDGEGETTEGIIEGTISDEIKGENGFGYDPVFIVPEYNKTFAEIGLEIKNKISHRAQALNKMKEILKGSDLDI